MPAGADLSSAAEAFLTHYRGLLEKYPITIVLLCGSLPPGIPPDYYGTLIDAAKAKGIPAILDTSGAPLLQSLAHSPLMAKPNLAEAREAFGSADSDALEERLRALSLSIRLVALTLGGDGAVFFTEGRRIEAKSPARSAVSSVGAGDAFVAGLACAYARFGFDLDALITWSMAAGACTAQSPGITWEQSLFRTMLAREERTHRAIPSEDNGNDIPPS